MRIILALIVALASNAALAQTQQRTFENSMGRNTGRSVTDTRGNTTFYDNMGRNTGARPRATAPQRSTTTWVGRPER